MILSMLDHQSIYRHIVIFIITLPNVMSSQAAHCIISTDLYQSQHHATEFRSAFATEESQYPLLYGSS